MGTSAKASARERRIKAALKKAHRPDQVRGAGRKTVISVCAGTACHASGRIAVREALEKEIEARGLGDRVAVVETGCHGFCEQGPIVVLRPEGIFYPHVKPTDMARIVETSVVGDEVLEQLLYHHPQTGAPLTHEADIPFYAGQQRVVLGLNGRIDPTSIDDYLAHGGYAALATVLLAVG